MLKKKLIKNIVKIYREKISIINNLTKKFKS